MSDAVVMSNIPFEPLNKVANELAEDVWHTPAGKRCGLCRELFNAQRVPKGIFRCSYSFEAGGFTQSARLICQECLRDIRERGIPDSLKAETAREVIASILMPGPLNAN